MTPPQTSQPFDTVAETYDAQFTHTRLGRWLRDAVWAHLASAYQPGDRILELGCGTGEDALWLARRGVHVTATDASPAMLEVARRKARAAGVGGQISFAQLDLARIGDRVFGTGNWGPGTDDPRSATRGWESNRPDPRSPLAAYDGVFSNFGALNCLPDRRPLAAVLSRRVRPGGRVVLVLMSPVCPWEMVWHLAHGEAGTAFRRLRTGARADLGSGAGARVWYPSPRRLRAEFAPEFRLIRTVGIGVLLPPSYLNHLVERWPRLFGVLAAWDRRLGGRFPWRWLNDHYLAIFERE